jgi:hypothetical protein
MWNGAFQPLIPRHNMSSVYGTRRRITLNKQWRTADTGWFSDREFVAYYRKRQQTYYEIFKNTSIYDRENLNSLRGFEMVCTHSVQLLRINISALFGFADSL